MLNPTILWLHQELLRAGGPIQPKGCASGLSSCNPLTPALLQIIRPVSHSFIYINFQTAILLKIGFHYLKNKSEKTTTHKYRKEMNKKQAKKQININFFHLTDFLNTRPENLGNSSTGTETNPVLPTLHSAFLLLSLMAKTQAVGVASLSLLGLGLPGHVAQMNG